MDSPEKQRLLKLYAEKREDYRAMVGKRSRGECTHLELEEAQKAMDAIGKMLVAMVKNQNNEASG